MVELRELVVLKELVEWRDELRFQVKFGLVERVGYAEIHGWFE